MTRQVAVVTGSHGYIGSILCKYLKNNDFVVYGIDWNADDNPEVDKYCDFVINNSFDSSEALQAYTDADFVFHLAAKSEVGPSAQQPAHYFHNNVGRTANLLDTLQTEGWRGHLVFASTAAVYEAQDRPIKETDKLQPPNNYGASKLMCEQVIQAQTAIENSFTATIFRFFNVAGGYEELGEPPHDSHLITKMCAAAQRREPAVIYGSDFDTRDGTCVRDYLHVRDVARAMIHAIERIDPSKPVRTYNLGTSKGTSVLEMMATMGIEVVPTFEWVYGDRREGDPASLIADPGLYIQDTDFHYKHSDLRNIIESAWEHYSRDYHGI